jgi:CDP-paratose 2-epimerase
MTTSIENPRLDFEVNALGTLNVLEAVRLHSPTTVVLYSSTNKVYGSLDYLSYEETETRYVLPDYPDGLDESLPLDGHSPYGCSKLAADQYVCDYHRIYGIPTLVFRFSSIYGGRQFATYDQGWIGWFCQQALGTKREALKESFTISGSGKQVRDVLHVEDIKRLCFAAVQHIDQIQGQAFNIGGGMQNSLSLLELFALLEELLDVQLQYRKLPPRDSDQKVFVTDTRKAQGLLQWAPCVGAREGIRNMLVWLQGG